MGTPGRGRDGAPGLGVAGRILVSTTQPAAQSSSNAEPTADASPARPRLLRGAPIAAEIRSAAKQEATAFRDRHGYSPALAILVAGHDEACAVYLHQILRTCSNVGIEGRLVELPEDVTSVRLRAEMEALNGDPRVAGIIVQMPLPKGIDARTVIDSIDPAKDIDGIHPLNAGLLSMGYGGFVPATARASIEILKRSGIVLDGARAVVVGRSNVIGRPVSLLLTRENATVTVCHSRTHNLGRHLREAEVVVVAIGRAGLVTGDMLSPGAVVVDVGTNVVGESLVGDVDYESVKDVVAAITPVPGGVGPVTNAVLMSNLMAAANAQAAARP
jgi:methylenetetrahydrofolate dehydrogenase (NADP+)/methenyltetrahydrofolate cyclohydrolase